MAGKTTPATKVAQKARTEFKLHPYQSGDGDEGYGLGAAKALGVEPERVFKTLVVLIDRRQLGVAIIPVHKQLTLKAAAAAFGGKKAVMADPKVAQTATGYVVGGISPLGQKKRLPKVIDESILALDTVIVSAGRRGLMMELTGDALVQLTEAKVATLTGN